MPLSSSTVTSSTLTRALVAVALSTAFAHGAQAQAASATAAPAPEAAEIQRLLKGNQNAAALKLIDEALARNPKDAQMRFRRGVALSLLDRKAEALAVFQKLVEDHPDMPSPYNNLAVIYGSQGDYEKARAALEKAIRTNPAYATAYQNLGDVYAQLASQAYSKALQLDKSDTNVPTKLALLRELNSGMAPAAPATPAAVASPPPTPAKPPQAAPAKPTQVAVAAPAPVPAPVPAAASRPTPAATPVAAPAPVAASKPAPAPAPAPTPPANANGVADVESAVRAWAAAWSRRDMPAYFAAYTADFTGPAKSHRAWEEDRKSRIATRKHIQVEISDLRVSVNGDKAQAQFRQSYQSDALSTSGRKTLDLVRAGGKWLIRQESVGG